MRREEEPPTNDRADAREDARNSITAPREIIPRAGTPCLKLRISELWAQDRNDYNKLLPHASHRARGSAFSPLENWSSCEIANDFGKVLPAGRFCYTLANR